MKHILPKLPYAYDALEPYIDAKTMEIHHTKHHQAYIDKLNTVLEKYPDFQQLPIDDLLRKLEHIRIEEADRVVIKNQGGGHSNHSFFWSIMGPKKEIDEKLVADINDSFSSVSEFKKIFTEAAIKIFGSGWAWLARDQEGALHIHGLPNQDSPLLHGHTPVIGLDVWEHAYYLKYQNKRPDYIEAWWKVLKLI